MFQYTVLFLSALLLFGCTYSPLESGSYKSTHPQFYRIDLDLENQKALLYTSFEEKGITSSKATISATVVQHKSEITFSKFKTDVLPSERPPEIMTKRTDNGFTLRYVDLLVQLLSESARNKPFLDTTEMILFELG